MTIETIKTIIEVAVVSTLVISLIVTIFLSISKQSQINLLKTQISNFKSKIKLEIELNKKMSLFNSLVSNAVYIGLFGTTLGVIITLQNVGVDKGKVIASLSLPLISTAISIIVAIISSFFYNHTTDKIEEILKTWDLENDNNKETR